MGVSGTAEFNGVNRDIRADRIRPLVDWVAQCFAQINTRSVMSWAGLRPMLPNMMPRVDRDKASHVFFNTGHGHLGWTLAAVKADMLGDVVAAGPANVGGLKIRTSRSPASGPSGEVDIFAIELISLRQSTPRLAAHMA